jgi:hypothetical protein
MRGSQNYLLQSFEDAMSTEHLSTLVLEAQQSLQLERLNELYDMAVTGALSPDASATVLEGLARNELASLEMLGWLAPRFADAVAQNGQLVVMAKRHMGFWMLWKREAVRSVARSKYLPAVLQQYLAEAQKWRTDGPGWWADLAENPSLDGMVGAWLTRHAGADVAEMVKKNLSGRAILLSPVSELARIRLPFWDGSFFGREAARCESVSSARDCVVAGWGLVV